MSQELFKKKRQGPGFGAPPRGASSTEELLQEVCEKRVCISIYNKASQLVQCINLCHHIGSRPFRPVFLLRRKPLRARGKELVFLPRGSLKSSCTYGKESVATNSLIRSRTDTEKQQRTQTTAGFEGGGGNLFPEISQKHQVSKSDQ